MAIWPKLYCFGKLWWPGFRHASPSTNLCGKVKWKLGWSCIVLGNYVGLVSGTLLLQPIDIDNIFFSRRLRGHEFNRQLVKTYEDKIPTLRGVNFPSHSKSVARDLSFIQYLFNFADHLLKILWAFFKRGWEDQDIQWKIEILLKRYSFMKLWWHDFRNTFPSNNRAR